MKRDSPMEPLPVGATEPIQPKRNKSKMRLTLTGLALLVVLAICWYIGVFGGNVHVVARGRVYRSAQLTGNAIGPLTACWTGHSLAQVIQANGIKTVLNLRGGSEKNDWYREERDICARLGVKHVDIFMSAIHAPHPVQLRRVLATFDHAPYPILYHCQGGSDRSGMVGTLYLHLYQGVPLDEAEQQQLTLRYGHIKYTRTGIIDRFFDMYRETSNGMGMREWIDKVYPKLYAELPANQQSSPPTAEELKTDVQANIQ